MTVSLQDILDDPKAPVLVAAAQKALEEEAKRRADFRDWVNPNQKAEFINGTVIMHSPVKRGHSIASEYLFTLLNLYVRINNAGEVRHDKAMIALTRNDYEPDICFWEKEHTQTFTDSTVTYPAPNWIVEVLSKKTQKTDRTTKFKDYAAHGVREYWLIDPVKKIVEQYGLLSEQDTTYLPQGKYAITETITSLVLPGFVIPVSAIFDSEANLSVIQQWMRR